MVAVDGFTDLLDSPTYAVTAAVGDERSGCLVGFASQCSLSPVRFVVWLSKVNRTYGAGRRAPFLGVHLLRRDQYEPARLFGAESGDRVDKFARTRWEPGAGELPYSATPGHGSSAGWSGRPTGGTTSGSISHRSGETLKPSPGRRCSA